MKVLIADDDPISRRMVGASLMRAGYDPVIVADGTEVLRILAEPGSPRLVVLDWLMPELDGLEVCRAIRARDQEPYVYVLLLTSNDRLQDIVEGLDAGADDFMSKPCDLDELQARLRAGVRILDLQDQLITAREALRQQATHDVLTGLLNRGAILDALQKEGARSDRTGASIGVIMIDIDNFKTINDTCGHLVGDGVLRDLAWRLRSALRTYDAIGRFGGEEFLVVAPGCTVTAAQELAERLRVCVSNAKVGSAGRPMTVTISLGVAAGAAGAPRDRLLRRADDALYAAKSSGRNRVAVDPASRS